MTVVVGLTQMPIYVGWYGFKTIDAMGWTAAALCLAFAVLSIIAVRIVMTPIVRLTYKFEAANADYRFRNVLIKEQAESIALNRGQAREGPLLETLLEKALELQKRLANNQILMGIVTNTFRYFGNGLVYVCIYVASPFDVSGPDLAAFVARVSLLTINFIIGLTMIVTVTQNAAKLCGYSTRIHELWDTLDHHNRIMMAAEEGDRIEIRNVTIISPSAQVLIRELAFAVEPTESLFISGPSGSGKSSILRILGQIWPTASGSIVRPPQSPESMMVLTQIPYIPAGTLYEACAFPLTPDEVAAHSIYEALVFLGILGLAYRPESVWRIGLSPGQKQRIALTRIFIHQPKFLLMDEATSAIPQSLERRVFEWIREKQITLISIAHRPYLRSFHKYSLVLDGRKSYQFFENDCTE
jgi:ABC-type uncharacterized transport system fused permease/ATPase subunit